MSEIRKKIWPDYFGLIQQGKKKFELRLADFEIKQGDTLILEEWDPNTKQYTGRTIKRKVSFVLKFNLDDFGQEEAIKKYGLYVIELCKVKQKTT